MKNWCTLARECPYFVVEWNRAKNELRLTCTGEWGRTCLIWQELEVLIPSTGYKGKVDA